MNHYALKFAREAYEDAIRERTIHGFTCDITHDQVAELKAEYDRQRRIFVESLPKKKSV